MIARPRAASLVVWIPQAGFEGVNELCVQTVRFDGGTRHWKAAVDQAPVLDGLSIVHTQAVHRLADAIPRSN